MIEKGSNVKLHYTLVVDGETLDSSRDREPLPYLHGEGRLVPGLESELEGMKVGEQKNVTVSPEQGYGPHLPEALHEVPRTAFEDSSNMKVGDRVTGQAQGQSFEAIVAEVTDDQIKLDLNHPLAGKTLQFEVEVVEIA